MFRLLVIRKCIGDADLFWDVVWTLLWVFVVEPVGAIERKFSMSMSYSSTSIFTHLILIHCCSSFPFYNTQNRKELHRGYLWYKKRCATAHIATAQTIDNRLSCEWDNTAMAVVASAGACATQYGNKGNPPQQCAATVCKNIQQPSPAPPCNWPGRNINSEESGKG